MKIIRKSDSQLGTNNSVCSVKEYSFLDNDIDLGVATITGRYPQNKFCLNTISKELVYVLEGTGILHTIKKDLSYKEGFKL